MSRVPSDPKNPSCDPKTPSPNINILAYYHHHAIHTECNKAYDLASLIDDVRLKTSFALKNSIYNYYIHLNKKKINENYFRNDFEILSVLRNLKIIGIFTRLAIRDKKKKYLKLIPYAWKLIENRINNNIIFANLKNYLDDNFSMKTRMKK